MKTFFAFLLMFIAGVIFLLNSHFDIGFSIICASVIYLFKSLISPEQPTTASQSSSNTGYMSHQEFYAKKANSNKKRAYTGRAPVALMAKYEHYKTTEQPKPKDTKNSWYSDNRKDSRFSDDDDMAEILNAPPNTGLRYNPATGLLLIDGLIDTAGNPIGLDTNSSVYNDDSNDFSNNSGFIDDSFSSFDGGSSFDMDSFSSFDDF